MTKRFAVAGVMTLAGVAAWLGAQALTPQKPASESMPAGPLFYLEARDFSRLVSGWDSSPEKKAWLESANYQAWTRSHLATRLEEIRKSYAEAAGVAETSPILDGLAGSESAVAFYDIGKLEFLYVTEIGSARFANSVLAKVRQKFEPRKAGGRDYFVFSKGGNTIAFALAGGRLILATREDLLASSLRLLAGEKIDSLAGERWFTDALGKAPSGSPDVRFVADLARTAKTHQFRSYWVQRNVGQLQPFASEVADLQFGPAAIEERRVFLRLQAQDGLTAFEPVVDELMRYAAPDAGFTQAVASPDARETAGLLAEKLFGHRPTPVERPDRNRLAPDAPAGVEAGGESDYQTRVDAPQVAEPLTDEFAPLSELARNADGLLQTGAAQKALLPGIDSAVALHGLKPWNASDVKRVLGDVAGAVWSVAPGSLEWVDHDGVSELKSITPLRFAIDGNVLVMSASPQWISRRPGAAGGPGNASYRASFRYASELPGFERMLGLMDFPSLPQGQQQASDAREPLFFSENIGSLAAALARLDSVSITARDTGAQVSQTVVYNKK